MDTTVTTTAAKPDTFAISIKDVLDAHELHIGRRGRLTCECGRKAVTLVDQTEHRRAEIAAAGIVLYSTAGA